jgi:hypothetical protein
MLPNRSGSCGSDCFGNANDFAIQLFSIKIWIIVIRTYGAFCIAYQSLGKTGERIESKTCHDCLTFNSAG